MNLGFPKPKKRKKKKREGMDPKHLENIRKLPCCICGVSPSEAHHLKQGTGERGMGMRSSDRWALPLCHEHHINGVERVASRREGCWFRGHDIDDPLALARALWSGKHSLDVMFNIIERNRP